MTNPGQPPPSRDLVSSVRHGLLNPLHNILYLTDLVISGIEGEVSQVVRGDVQQMRASALELQAMLNDVLELTRIEHVTYACHALDIEVVVRQACMNRQALAQSKGIQIRLAEAKNVFPVNADGVALCQATEILLANAIAFAAHQTICLSLAMDGTSVVVSIAEGHKSVNAARGVAVAWPEARCNDKHGLELLIATRIIERHDGKVWVSQRPKRKGLIICFSLPIAEWRDDAPATD
jgi:signal transduction histidine kinase